MTVQSTILTACAAALEGVPGVSEVMVDRKLPIGENVEPGFAMLEITDVLSNPLGDRTYQNPARAVIVHDTLVTALLSAVSEDAAGDQAFRDGVVVEAARRFATSKELRAISHRFWLNRTRFRSFLRKGRPEIQALCEFRIVYRTHAIDPGVAIQPQ